MISRIFRVAIAGAGVGQSHARAFHLLRDRYIVTVICDAARPRAKEMARGFEAAGLPRPAIIGDYRDAALVGDNVDIVVVCLPPWLHADAARFALEGGKNVIIEKPIAGSLAEVDEIGSLAEARKVKVMPVFQYRFGHGLAKAKRLIDEGIAGKIFLTTIETHWTRGANYYAVSWRGTMKGELGGLLTGHAI